ncbi:YjjG family noncanonical pyrimidine nucleotidase [Fulvivirga sp. 29W222]|uniref:YjjG family noncanonical pyrimidine nucleotidase n=1 Tax=Fulvivirga marina TaxID=2494733 RepID=A0A937KC65_9BACT|nr:YjjG family noncanonical pyrimidine nucleotidase [Fulvivirga marina]MBL6447034.1 YjjG family noncanonical pyrimidine nucleotidase [Fulvivirga marina]
MQKYKVILFDLDHTLWDYDKNSRETLNEIYINYKLKTLCGFSFDQFNYRFSKVNSGLWRQYDHGLIDRSTIRKERFNRILNHFRIQDSELALRMADDYLNICPTKTNLLPFAHDALSYLKQKYDMYILTNGFDDVQEIKLSKSNLKSYFSGMITSETIGHRKPSKEIFNHALEVAGSACHNTLMIGDNLLADILGAKGASIDSVYFNPLQKEHRESIHLEINCLSQLMNIL